MSVTFGGKYFCHRFSVQVVNLACIYYKTHIFHISLLCTRQAFLKFLKKSDYVAGKGIYQKCASKCFSDLLSTVFIFTSFQMRHFPSASTFLSSGGNLV